jgi:hypothetical protein
MITLDEARCIIRGCIEPGEPVMMPLAAARGRVRREAVLAPEDSRPSTARPWMEGLWRKVRELASVMNCWPGALRQAADCRRGSGSRACRRDAVYGFGSSS